MIENKISLRSSCKSIVEFVKQRAHHNLSKIAYTFLEDGEQNEINITYQELDHEAKKIAAHLQRLFKRGDRIVLFFPPGLDFIKAFYGCLYAGMIAVPSYPPKANRSGERMVGILNDANPACILTVSLAEYEKILVKMGIDPALIVNIDEINDSESSFIDSELLPEELAFLQYTSGSTGTPKGVMVSHGNIMHNEELIRQTFMLDESSVLVGWLPFYHDMGLVGNILQSAYSGFRCILMAPIHFLQEPKRWLKAIDKYQATVSGGPNFAYDLCFRTILKEDIENLSLASWKVAFNGAEPIQAETLKNFVERFSNYEFQDTSFLPCYGMAETTLLVSGILATEKPIITDFKLSELQYDGEDVRTEAEHVVSLVSCGNPNGYDIRIVGSDGEVVSEEHVGEIWLRNGSVTQGYWNNPERTTADFEAQLSNEEGMFLRTGDLGLLKNGQLYITGRLKDILIINGQNFYPQDIELTVWNSNDSIIAHAVAAFGVEYVNREQLVVVAEAKYSEGLDTGKIIEDIRKQIIALYNLPILDIVLIRRGAILKTTSGKIQRRACKEAYLTRQFKVLAHLASAQSAVEEKIEKEKWSELELGIYNYIKTELGDVKSFSKTTSFFDLGIDSIFVTRLVAHLKSLSGKEITADVIYEKDTIETLALHIHEVQEKIVEIVPIKEDELVVASHLQVNIWINQQRNPAGTGYHIPVVLDYGEVIDLNLLQQSVDWLVEKHEILRTSFEFNQTDLFQVVKKNADIRVKIIETPTKESYQEQLRATAGSAFDLEHGPLFRIALFKKQDAYSVVFIFHHILVDATSIILLIRDFEKAYRSLLKGFKGHLSDKNTYQFRDFAKHERTLSNQPSFESKKEYWAKELSGNLPSITFPHENLVTGSSNRKGSSIYFEVDEIKYAAVKRTLDLHRINLFSLLLTVYKLLLYRLTDESDVLIGTPVSLRDREEFEEVTGLLINTVVHRTSFHEHTKVSDLLKMVYQQSRKGLQNAAFPFGEVLKVLDRISSQDQLAITSVFFNYLDFPEKKISQSLFDAYRSNPGVDLNFDLNLYVLPGQETIAFRLDYCQSQYTRDSIGNVVALFNSLLTEIIEFPEVMIGELNSQFLKLQNKIQPINDFLPFGGNDKKDSVVEKFNLVARQLADRVAIKTKEGFYTYHDVLQKSNGIAILLEKFTQREHRQIGLLFGHSANMIFSMLGVLKVGSAYVPCDINYPSDRLSEMLIDAGVQTLLTDSEHLHYAERLQARSELNINIINIDEVIALAEYTSPAQSKLAYILYTSGSTGAPKGVMQNQKYIAHIAYSFINSLKITPSDCIGLVASFSFSASMMDVFSALLSGAALSLIDIRNEGIASLIHYTKEHTVTVYHSTPTVFRGFTDELNQMQNNTSSVQSIRLIYLAGEPLLNTDVSAFKKIFREDCLLVNGLGCTEFNICSQYFIDKSTDVLSSTVSLGYDAKGVEVIIFDENGQESKNLVIGEIGIKSNYLTEGYHNLPQLTEEKLRPYHREKIFLTGDIGRRLPDGRLLHMGRKDFQVKVRGQRVELGDIESRILQIESIQGATVVLRNVNGQDALCAYIKSNQPVSTVTILNHLKSSLPSYMIPDQVVFLEAFPLTTTGKVDRKRLPVFETNLVSYDNQPLTETEDKLRLIWSELLTIKKNDIGPTSEFFTVGGNSLKAMQLIGRVNKEFGVKLSVSNIFQSTRLGQMASLLDNSLKTEFNHIPVLSDENAETQRQAPFTNKITI